MGKRGPPPNDARRKHDDRHGKVKVTSCVYCRRGMLSPELIETLAAYATSHVKATEYKDIALSRKHNKSADEDEAWVWHYAAKAKTETTRDDLIKAIFRFARYSVDDTE